MFHHSPFPRLLVLATALLGQPMPVPAFGQETRPAPEAGTAIQQKGAQTALRQMVVAADPAASAAGLEILRKGGSAVDAAIATQLVLGLVEPQSSGLGGGAFLVHFDARQKSVTSYDGREAAPAAARPERFISDGKEMEFDFAVRSGLSVGVPGVMRMLELAHQKHGKLPWAELFAPAIKLAEKGFAVSKRLSTLLYYEGADRFAPAARSYFFDGNGVARAPGERLRNPEYAATLKTLAERGAGALYDGELARSIVAAVANAPSRPGDMTVADLAQYQAKERPAVCAEYRGRKVCGMGPPSSGGIAVAQTLELLQPFAQVQGSEARMSAAALHVIAEAEKLAYADRNRYVADPDFVPVPSGLLDASYLAERRSLIDVNKAKTGVAAGLPPGLAKSTFGVDATLERAGTSHMSIVDADGNAVSMTTTIEGAFGSHLWAAGFLLNNELTDFSFKPADESGVAIANAVTGGKRPRSSMAPTLVFGTDGGVEIVTGSPGGPQIILYVVKTLVAILDWGLDAQAAADEVNFGSRGQALEIEDRWAAAWVALKLNLIYGQQINLINMTSGVHTILKRDGRLIGGADPRRQGAALGD